MFLNFPEVKTGDKMFLIVFHFSPSKTVNMSMKYLLDFRLTAIFRRSTK